jgi:pyruvate ferredoxin oxidoreductase alpha subunit
MIVHGGVEGGIERWSKILMPILFVLLIVLIIYANSLQDSSKGLSFYLNPDFSKISGRSYGNGLVDCYRLEDAKVAAVCLGSTAGTTKTVVDQLRAEGVKAGVLRLRTFRPFPTEDVIEALENIEAVAVMDRCLSFGAYGGPLFHEIRHTLYDISRHPQVTNYIYGLGGRDMPQSLIRKIYQNLQKTVEAKHVEKTVQFIGVR